MPRYRQAEPYHYTWQQEAIDVAKDVAEVILGVVVLLALMFGIPFLLWLGVGGMTTATSNEAAERLFDVIDVRTALEPRAKTAIKNSIHALQHAERRATVERIRERIRDSVLLRELMEFYLDEEAAR